MPDERGPGAARERMAYPRAGTAPAPPLRPAFRKGALGERDSVFVTQTVTNVNENVTEYCDVLSEQNARQQLMSLRLAPGAVSDQDAFFPAAIFGF